MASPSVDLKTAVDFLSWLRPEGPWPLTAIVPDGNTVTTTVHTADEVRAFVEKHNGTRNIYYSVNPTKHPISKKAAKADIAAAEFVFADLDPRDGESVENAKARYLDALDKHGLPPSGLIDSGNGLQGLWRIDAPVPPETSNPIDPFPNFEARIATIIAALGGSTGTQNVDRILRLPGTINWPNAKKRRVERVECESKAIHLNGSTYPIDAFPVGDVPRNRAKAQGAKKSSKKKTADDRTVDDIIRNGCGEHFGGDRSKAVWFVVQEKRREGLNRGAIEAMLLDKKNAISDHIYDQSDPKGYAAKQVEKVFARKKTIQVVPGEIARVADETQQALIAADRPIFNRGRVLVEPIFTKMPTRHGREVDVTVLRPLRVETLQYMLSKHAADYARYDGRSKSWKPIDPPKDALLSLLNIGHWDFPGIAGVVNSPTLRPDGSILSEVGYDAKTKLWCGIDRDLTLPPVPDKPTKEQALAALNLLKRLFCESAFIDNLDRSVALAAMLSAVVRGAFDVAPMTLFKAHSPGSGKSFIVDVIAYLVTGRAAPVITASRSIDEMEKRIGSLILESVPLVSLDNATIDLGGELLCQVTERPTVKTRILGKSETPECEWRGSIYATGNNITFIGDMTRRGLVCNVDAGVEQPELRHFEFDPIADVLADRGKYLAAALTIVRAFLVSGEKVECDPLGSYGGWSRFVREPLLWLGEPDPVASMKQLRADDPERSAAHALVELWAEHLEKAPRSYKVNEIIRLANEGEMEINAQGVPERMYVRHALHDLLLTEAGGTGNREIDPRRLGKWLGRLNGAVYGSWRIRKVRHSNSHGDDWALEVAPGRATPSD